MASAGVHLEGPHGMTLRFVAADEATLQMEARYPADAAMPPMHLHPFQEERFEVLEGTVRAVIGGEERLYVRGDVFGVPAGVAHQMSSHEGPARLGWQVRPPLRTWEFFSRSYGGEVEDWPAFLREFSAEIRLISEEGS